MENIKKKYKKGVMGIAIGIIVSIIGLVSLNKTGWFLTYFTLISGMLLCVVSFFYILYVMDNVAKDD
jgi:hypothetical protein